MNEVLPALTSEDNHFVNDILSLVSAGSYIARTAVEDHRRTEAMAGYISEMGMDALRSRFLSKGVDEPDVKVRAGAEFMEQVDERLRTGVSARVILDELRAAMEKAGASFELPPTPEPGETLSQMLEELRDSLQGKKS